MSQSAKVTLAIDVSQTSTSGIGSSLNNIKYDKIHALLDGVGLNQANQVWSSSATLAPSAVDSIDLAGGINSAFGSAITLSSVTTIAVVASIDNGDNIEVGGNANAFASFLGAATDIIKIPPGGIMLLTAPDVVGFPVTAGTGDILDITNANAGASADYKIIIIGRE